MKTELHETRSRFFAALHVRIGAMPIGARLKFAFGLIIGLLVVISLLALFEKIQSHRDMGKTVAATRRVELTQRITSTLYERSSTAFNALLTIDHLVLEQERELYEEHTKRYNELFQRLSTSGLLDAERELIAGSAADNRTLDVLIRRSFDLREKGDIEEAGVLLVRGVRPQQQALVKRMTDLAALQSGASRAALARAETTHFMTLIGLAALNLLALAGAFVASRLILRSITQPLGALLDGVRLVQGGDLNVDVRCGGRDEIGFLSRGFNDMVVSIKQSQELLKHHAEQLERQVQVRTAKLSEAVNDLSASLENIRQLKYQQDGDYYLTSLLVRPFSGDFARPSASVGTDILVQQKKKFCFKHWNTEIGGDLCITQNVDLHGGRYLAFVNADAMGKSLQGAGGAIVFGTAFRALIERSRVKRETRDLHAEQWLYQCYHELQSVFTAFDGSMCMSAVIGLVNEATGVLHFINADHPRPVLLRDGRASFAEAPLLSKLGISMPGEIYRMQSLRLRPGDCFVTGSDGRDDLYESSPAGQRRMNEDETAFLRAVEAAAPDTTGIQERLAELGEFSDDLSLLSISFRGVAESPPRTTADRTRTSADKALRDILKNRNDPGFLTNLENLYRRFPDSAPILRRLGKEWLRAGRYAEAAELLAGCTCKDELCTDSLYHASVAYRMCGQLNEACEYGERCRIRWPECVANLINLADAYLQLGNAGRARTLAQQALLHEPQNPRAQDMMNRRVSV